MTPSTLFVALVALVVAIYTVRHAVDVWQCGSATPDWLRLAKQLLCVVLVAAALRLLPRVLAIVAVVAAGAALAYGQFAFPEEADWALDGVCLALAVVAAFRTATA